MQQFQNVVHVEKAGGKSSISSATSSMKPLSKPTTQPIEMTIEEQEKLI